MKNNNIIKNIYNQLSKGETISPFLFLGKNSEILNSQVINLWYEILKIFEIPKVYLYIFQDNWEKIKIKEIKEFIEPSNSKPPYKFQIFLIENISRFTISAWNSLLKFFEEPENSNLIFLTNSSESWVLDTILSRVQIINLWWQNIIKKSEFYINLIDKYKKEKNTEILSYFYRNKLEKEDYLDFLENFIIYSKENLLFIEFLDEINEDINSIKQNNVNAKFIIDKWLLRI